MPLDLKSQQKLAELKKKYGFDIAVLKQTPENKDIKDQELYKSLLIFDLQTKLTEMLNDYAEDVNFEHQELATLVTMLFNSTGEIVANIARQNPKYLLLFKDIAIKQFEKHIKDFYNGKPSK